MPDMYFDVDTALPEVPVNLMPLIDDTDFKTIEGAIAYNAAGMTLRWHFVTSAGAYTVTSVTPTTGGNYDWTDQGDSGVYTIEIPASGGASINNDTEGYGWFTGVCTGVLPWRGPVIGFRAAGLNDLLCDSAYSTTRGLSGTALPNAAADAAGGLPISDAGGLDLDAQVGTKINDILTDTGTTLQAELDGIQADTEDIQSRLPAALVGGRIDANVGAISADSTAADNAEAFFDGTGYAGTNNVIPSVTTVTGNVNGSVASVTGNVGGNVTGSVGTVNALAANVITAAATAADFTTEIQSGLATAAALATVDTVVDSIKVTTDKLDDTLEDDAGTFRFTTNALEQGPGGGSAPSAADVADAVWRELLADHDSVSGSAAEALSAAGSAGDPWITALPGAYSSGQAGFILGTNLNATVSSRASQASVDTIDGIVDNILVDTAEIGAAGAGLTALASAAAVADVPTVAEFEARTIAAASYATATDLATVDTVVDTVKAKTDQLTFTVANVLDANIQRINDVTITGDGQVGTEFGV